MSSSKPYHQQHIIPPTSTSPLAFPRYLLSNILAALSRLTTSLSPSLTISKIRSHKFRLKNDYPHIILYSFWLISLLVMETPSFPSKLLIPLLYTIIVLIPLTSQFFFPATPILTWLITFYSCRYIPPSYRPSIHVALLPTLESTLYGANISDLLTRYTHPALDVLAWLPYGVLHFVIPFVIAAVSFVFGPRGSINFWGKAFGYMNLTGVLIQIMFPCASPWYELIHGLTPAEYSMKGSAGGLSRIDHIFGGSGYTDTFSAAPLIFGAFPSLHAGSATIEALFLSHFFPRFKVFYWIYVAILYWATMYLTHHYLIDVVAGACLATLCFYYLLPSELKEWENATVGRFEEYSLVDQQPSSLSAHSELDDEIRKLEEGDLAHISSSDDDDDSHPKASSSSSTNQPQPSSSSSSKPSTSRLSADSIGGDIGGSGSVTPKRSGSRNGERE